MLLLLLLLSHLKNAMYTSAISVFEKKENWSEEKCEAYWAQIQPLTDEIKKALLTFKPKSCISVCDAHRATQNKEKDFTRFHSK